MVCKGRLGSALALPVLGLALLAGCNDHPVERLENTVTSVNREDNKLPAKTKLDFLFVVDNSGSMCDEQLSLARNFTTFSNFLFEQLGAAADYRIAVTTTNMSRTGDGGQFIARPAEPGSLAATECPDLQVDDRCFGVELPTVIKSGRDGNIGRDCAEGDEDCVKADLELKFGCLTSIGGAGANDEMGLEAMRVALSCDGPNADRFGDCCVDGNYNPSCEIPEGEAGPDFLRPDAILVVVIVSDEDDCSTPVTNPDASKLAICKYVGVDRMGEVFFSDERPNGPDGVPDGYTDADICGALSPAECMERECGSYGGASTADKLAACREERCTIEDAVFSSCYWHADRLTPVADYYEFLSSLKGEPGEQLLLAAIVGHNDFTTDTQKLIRYVEPTSNTDPRCLVNNDAFDPDLAKTETCCPGGRCEGEVQPSCTTAIGNGFAGGRYTDLVALMDETNSGIGCIDGPDSEESECVHICTEDFAGPLEAIRDRVINLIARYCLNKPPACQVTDAEGETRNCESAEEFADNGNYAIRIRQECLVTEDQGGNCVERIDPHVLTRDQWTISPSTGCTGGYVIELTDAPPAGSSIRIEFLVDVTSQGRPEADAEVMSVESDASVAE